MTGSLQVLAAMAALGACLIAWNTYSVSRDAALAAGPKSPAQERFFVQAADRPDIETFFRRLTPAKRISMAADIGRYSDPQLAGLISKLLLSVDVDAHDALYASMKHLAASQPDAVAAELKQTGSFQLRAVFDALNSLGPAAAPYAAAQLSVDDALPNAVDFLVQLGPPGAAPLVQALDSDKGAIRQAAADGLAKLRHVAAAPKLRQLYDAATAADKPGYLAALCAIADPSSESLLTDILDSTSSPGPDRAQAAFGLGRIASQSSVATLWADFDDPDSELKATVLSGLRIAGDVALKSPKANPQGLIAVAAEVKSAAADAAISVALAEPDQRLAAARAATGRGALVGPLVKAVAAANPDADGEFIDAAIASLLSTDAGAKECQTLESKPGLKGFVLRRLNLASGPRQTGS